MNIIKWLKTPKAKCQVCGKRYRPRDKGQRLREKCRRHDPGPVDTRLEVQDGFVGFDSKWVRR